MPTPDSRVALCRTVLNTWKFPENNTNTDDSGIKLCFVTPTNPTPEPWPL